jgi:hypothetical protein
MRVPGAAPQARKSAPSSRIGGVLTRSDVRMHGRRPVSQIRSMRMWGPAGPSRSLVHAATLSRLRRYSNKAKKGAHFRPFTAEARVSQHNGHSSEAVLQVPVTILTG